MKNIKTQMVASNTRSVSAKMAGKIVQATMKIKCLKCSTLTFNAPYYLV